MAPLVLTNCKNGIFSNVTSRQRQCLFHRPGGCRPGIPRPICNGEEGVALGSTGFCCRRRYGYVCFSHPGLTLVLPVVAYSVWPCICPPDALSPTSARRNRWFNNTLHFHVDSRTRLSPSPSDTLTRPPNDLCNW